MRNRHMTGTHAHHTHGHACAERTRGLLYGHHVLVLEQDLEHRQRLVLVIRVGLRHQLVVLLARHRSLSVIVIIMIIMIIIVGMMTSIGVNC